MGRVQAPSPCQRSDLASFESPRCRDQGLRRPIETTLDPSWQTSVLAGIWAVLHLQRLPGDTESCVWSVLAIVICRFFQPGLSLLGGFSRRSDTAAGRRLEDPRGVATGS